MAGLTNAYASKAGNHFLRNSAQVPDVNLYVCLFTTLPADDATGGVEVVAGDYGRLGGAAGSQFGAASAGVISNSGTLAFIASAASSWGTIVGIGITNHVSNAVSSTTLLAFGSLVTSLSVPTGGSCSFAAGSITVTAPTLFTTAYRNKLLEHFFRNNTQAPDAVVGLALYTAAPDAAGAGGTECAASWYGRKSLGLSAFSNGTGSNAGDLLYVTTAASDGGVLQYAVVATSLTTGGGSVIAWQSLPAGIVAGVGSTVDFPAGTVSVRLD
jgi:hypothetical protein